MQRLPEPVATPPRRKLGVAAILAALALALAPAPPRGAARPREVELPVVRDTLVSSAKGERDANLGGARTLKTKGIVEIALFDVDVEPLRGKIVRRAALHLRAAAPDPQLRVSVSTVAGDWVEGTSTGYRRQAGSASFERAAEGERWWAGSGSDVTAAINGRGQTIWRFADATPPDAAGWQEIAVDPDLVAARVAGASYGFALTDDVGHEYERRGDRFEWRVFPNRKFFSRESGRDSAPFLTVELAGEDREPPAAVAFLPAAAAAPERLAPGGALVRWTTPADLGGAGTAAFEARYAESARLDWGSARPVPRHRVPAPGETGQAVEMDLDGLGLEPGTTVAVGVRAVDGAGNAGPVAETRVHTGPPSSRPALVGPPTWSSNPVEAPRLGGAAVSLLDPLDKVLPESGRTVPPRPAEYLLSNHLWSARRREVRLHAARNEFTAFQVALEGARGHFSARLEFAGGVADSTPRARLYRFAHVPGEREALPDPLLPVEPAGSRFELPWAGSEASRYSSLLADVYVPHEAEAGLHRGTLVLESGDERLEIRVVLTVWDFTLPDHLSFIPQMNTYGLPPPPAEVEYYRLAHEHRTTVNRLAYNWRGQVHDGFLPEVTGGGWDWRRWDRRFGPLFDGSAFADLPRRGVPVEAFYLPLNENWPAPLATGFRGGYWAERALAPEYRATFVEGARRFAEHIAASGWNETFFEFYLNNKVYHKKEGWDRSSAPWIFDEPVNTQDFWALRWYGLAFHEGAAAGLAGSRGPLPKLVFRADISRPEWQRDLLDGLLDVNVVGGGFTPYLEAVLERKRRHGEIVYNYGTSNRIEDSNVEPAAWCLRTWSLGGDGVLPWQSVGKAPAWERATPLAVLYPDPDGLPRALPSARLKAYRRGQQDVEYLVILAAATGASRAEIGRLAIAELGLGVETVGLGGEDAGTARFADLLPEDLWALRLRVGATLDRLAPPARRRLVELRTPRRDPAALARQRHFARR